jgi:hypothetical protein
LAGKRFKDKIHDAKLSSVDLRLSNNLSPEIFGLQIHLIFGSTTQAVKRGNTNQVATRNT